MKKIHKIIAAIAALALTAAFSSCSGNVSDNTGEADVTESVTESTETAEITTGETVSIPAISCFAEPETEQTTEDTEEEVKGFDYDGEEYVQVSPDNEFVDFKFIEDYQGTADIGDLADKAVEFLMTTDEYTDAMSKIEEIDVEFGEPYIKDGKLFPQFETAYPADYDGDGSTETFIMLKMPMRYSLSLLYRFFIFADSSENMVLLDHTFDIYDTFFLDYGKFKQITFGGEGTAGAEAHCGLYGVENGKAEVLYHDRCSFAKEDCFLSAFGWQGVGDFMYFDTAAQEYRVIDGIDVAIDDIRAMDTEDSLADILDDFWACQLIGGKYYCFITGMMDSGTIYTYGNGRFTLVEDSKVRRSDNLYEMPKVVDIDIEQAIANMKPVEN
ncbi:MAG: hypothetical protein K2H23_00385 [Oscillospiraceae bacterium]|nr:hypothetical protein [Oscillospiraceae bacterium]